MSNAATFPSSLADFIAYWQKAEANERANSQSFLIGLAHLLGVPAPAHSHAEGYSFEFPVKVPGGTSMNFIDLYRRGHFVLESKQFAAQKLAQTALEIAAVDAGAVEGRKKSGPVRGTGSWDDAMIRARGQAERYVRSLPADEPNPPFILVCDVGHSIEVYADFTQAGKAYLPFPDPRTFRIQLKDLEREDIRERLRLIWTNPAVLDPAKVSAEVTREIAGYLAELAKSLEKEGHDPEVVAQFLTRCLFCMFAEDVGLLPDRAFTELLNSIPASGEGFAELLGTLFREMNTGTSYSVTLRKKLLKFNGGLFADHNVLPVNSLQLGLLKQAASKQWKNVEPAIFGTLLERALVPEERHALGAHFTPRAYVERLVLPTVINPLREEWENVRAAAITHAKRATERADTVWSLEQSSSAKTKAGDLVGAKADYKKAQDEQKALDADMRKAQHEVLAYHDKLCRIRVLDPACGSGNFLYVALQHLKILEGEVLDVAGQFGEDMKLELETHTIDPHQFLGIELNPRAASIAELVLWIGYLQWHFKIHGQRTPPEPILRAFKNIECRDAVLAYDGEPQPARDAAGNVVTVWDRRSYKKDPITGRNVPDETHRAPLLSYANPRSAEWPDADYIVGNPPYIGARTLRPSLEDGYIEALRGAYPAVPDNVDLVMYWWFKSAELVRSGKANRFGLITTNSLRQSFNRSVVEPQMKAKPGMSLIYVAPDHPWVDESNGAAIRTAMSVGLAGIHEGLLCESVAEHTNDDGSVDVSFKFSTGLINSGLSIGTDVMEGTPLKANDGLCCVGYQLTGTGFALTNQQSEILASADNIPPGVIIHELLSARDITQESRSLNAIDLFDLSSEDTRNQYPSVYQWVFTRVKPERDSNARASLRDRWWIFGEARSTFRPALGTLRRMIVAPLTSKHRLFTFSNVRTIADSTTVMFAFDDAFHFGVLSSRVHGVFSLTAGGTLEDRPRYNKSVCFDPFPFPLCTEAEKDRIRQLAEQMDAHRKRVQAQHPGLTLTGMYNVLEKLRAEEPLTGKDKLIHDQGLVSLLRQLHDDLDAAVFAAYGWQHLWQAHLDAQAGTLLDFKTGTVSQLQATQEQINVAVAAFEKALDAEILQRLVALNAQRAAEEQRGIIHWLRPEYQNAAGKPAAEDTPELEHLDNPKAKAKNEPPKEQAHAAKPGAKQPWPKPLAERIRAAEQALHAAGHPVTAADLAQQFSRAKPADLQEILESLVTLGRALRHGEKFGV
ncbi:MAG TPA: DNA methyltransferase [Prosthecobacter sp.]